MNKINIFRFLLIFVFASYSFACDPCSLYNAWKLQGFESGGVMLSLSEQFTEFDAGVLPKDGEVVKSFSITQASLSYDFSKSFGLQASVPLIARNYDYYQDYRGSNDNEYGIGDSSILANYVPYSYSKLDTAIVLMTFAGIKLPTGDSDSLNQSETDSKTYTKNHTITTVSGGRALTLGSGSTDYIMGTGLVARHKRMALMSNFQYTIRTEGDFDYKFANEEVWDLGPAYYVNLQDSNSLAVRLALSGEHKSQDKRSGELVEGSKVQNLYLGPQILATFLGNMAGELALDLPVSTSSESSIVPDYRIRSALSYRF